MIHYIEKYATMYKVIFKCVTLILFYMQENTTWCIFPANITRLINYEIICYVDISFIKTLYILIFKAMKTKLIINCKATIAYILDVSRYIVFFCWFKIWPSIVLTNVNKYETNNRLMLINMRYQNINI